MTRASVARALTAVACLAAVGASTPQPLTISYGPVPRGAQTATVRKYVDALKARDYATAFGLLADDEHRYFGNVASFRSVFEADGVTLESASIVGARGDDRARVFLVRERIAFIDHATDARRRIDASVPIGVLPEHGTLRIKDPGKPYRAFASESTAAASGLRVTVKKVDFFPDRIDVIATFQNLGDGYVTLLPYAKSVLRDDRGGVYRVFAIKDWTVTDKHLFEGVPLAPNARYTGSIAFGAPRLDAPRRWSVTVAPALREGADEPFEVTVPIAPAP